MMKSRFCLSRFCVRGFVFRGFVRAVINVNPESWNKEDDDEEGISVFDIFKLSQPQCVYR